MSNPKNSSVWKARLECALSEAQTPSTANFFQLATFDEHQGPQVRTLVFRGFSSDGYRVLMATDLHSAKLDQAKYDNRGQILWYFVDAREQFRLTGFLQWIDSGDRNQSERTELWSSLSAGTRASFFANAMGVVSAGSDVDVSSDYPPDRFVLLSLTVRDVDHLDLKTQPHQRHRHYRVDGDWVTERAPINY